MNRNVIIAGMLVLLLMSSGASYQEFGSNHPEYDNSNYLSPDDIYNNWSTEPIECDDSPKEGRIGWGVLTQKEYFKRYGAIQAVCD